ncbi:NmrA family protein [Virgibacillus sp. 7505]|uniref:NAD(P)H-binding protein n=1 Tax=Virgibacillus sp. 7505 TaxID=2022548 RepID=UPI000BA6B002|nr:NAD(P)H-binding protein [Virgibacillus sp. 7505]PAE15466.1 NmrA family protein [Virgibacillus sp. 7505]
MQTEQKKRPVVALTGASGYIGSHLLDKLKERFDVIALSRSGDKQENTDRVTWRSCDLFSQIDTEKGLQGADIAVYLVHSMSPSAKLTQARFEDMDVILADNFAQAAKKNGVKQIVYLSGIIPPEEKLSRHLRSRLEVEKILGSYGVPVTTVRAGLIVGPKGSSFPIAEKLVKRLPVMVLPNWTRTKTHPIALADVLTALQKSVGNKDVANKAIDVGGPEVMTYKEMLEHISRVMGKKFRSIHVPFPTIKLSRLWVKLISGMPKETVYPLIESLSHPMVAQPSHYVEGISNGQILFDEAARTAMDEEQKSKDSKHSKKLTLPSPPPRQDVRSVQRMPLPSGRDAGWAAKHYMSWVSESLRPLVRTEVDDQLNCKIYLTFTKQPLLILSYAKERSTGHRALYYITGGLFANAKESQRGRIEFRQIPGKQEMVVAIHEYLPSLPWFVYKYTQAPIHMLVMFLYRKHLERLVRLKKQSGLQIPQLATKH